MKYLNDETWINNFLRKKPGAFKVHMIHKGKLTRKDKIVSLTYSASLGRVKAAMKDGRILSFSKIDLITMLEEYFDEV